MRIKNFLKRFYPIPTRSFHNEMARLHSEIHELNQKLSGNGQPGNWTCEREEMLKRIYSSDGKITVKRGPFAGMIYPSFTSTGSSLWPKLAGTYEKNLQPIIERALKKNYKYFLDIGCAEGYYAVGFALAAQRCGTKIEKILAYDTADIGRELCRNMAETNHVDVEIGTLCSEQTLADMDFDGAPSLIMADCEGYEREMFTKKNISNLGNTDLIIEVHDWCQNDSPTLDYLISLFAQSHDYELIYGIDDYEKAYRYKCEELRAFSINDRYEIFLEGRRRLAEWLYLTSKKQKSGMGGGYRYRVVSVPCVSFRENNAA